MRLGNLAVRALVLLAFLAGPFGLLALDHAELHGAACAGDSASSDEAMPCPICHAAGTPGLAAPGPASFVLPLDLVASRTEPATFRAPLAPLSPSLGPRAPPALS